MLRKQDSESSKINIPEIDNQCHNALYIDEKKLFKYLFIIALTLVCLFIMSRILYELGYIGKKIFLLLHLDGENNIPTWYSTVQLFAVGVTCFSITLRKVHFHFSKLDIIFWFCMTTGFCLLSLDEMVSIHECFDRSSILGIDLQYRWVIYFLPLVVGAIILFFILARKVFKNQKKILTKLTIGICCLFSAAMGIEMLKPVIFSSTTLSNIRGILTAQLIIEEFLEIISVSFILSTLIGYLNDFDTETIK